MPTDTGVHGSVAGAVSGWLEAVLFALALAALNVSYGIGHQLGVHPIALLIWAMPVAAIALLAVSGPGDDWLAVIAHPLSIVVGSGIIAMEAFYYMLLGVSTPTDGSVLARISVPITMALACVLGGGRPTRLAVVGGAVIAAAIGWYLPRMDTPAPVTAALLATACGLVISTRSFAAEYHPWNRKARSIREKMRVTGLVLLLASTIGAGLVLAAVTAEEFGLVALPTWLPHARQLCEPSAVMLGFAVGALVLTVMQYLGFSVVVKLGTQRFIATTALIPVVTLAVQALVVLAGILDPVPVDWSVIPVMAAIIAGVALVIAGNRRL